jgi:N-formylglutamate deformylase
MLIDGHSFPSIPLPYELDQGPERPDICIGTDPDHTPHWLRDLAVAVFEGLGWSVAVNRPFSGALVPFAYATHRRVGSVMVEVNRRLYMDESTGELGPAFEAVSDKVRRGVQELIHARR